MNARIVAVAGGPSRRPKRVNRGRLRGPHHAHRPGPARRRPGRRL